MISCIRLLLILTCLCSLLPLAAAHAVPPVPTQANVADTPSPFVPLPKSCGGGLPPGASIPTCCMFGYVFIDGQPVAGAKVTITSSHGSIEEWTDVGPDSPLPYYRTSLSAPPLSVQAGESITIQAEYSSHQRTMTYTALGGGQQVDVVLPRNQPDDYVYERQIWQQAAPGKFNHPGSVAIDGSGTVYVADANNARVQVFNRDGQFLFQWGTLGGQPGQFSLPYGVSVDSSGNVFVADLGNHRIQKFTSSGTWLASWGTQGSANGQFSSPSGVSVDSSGNVFVADTGNHRIQKLTNNGIWLTSWGTQGSANGQFNSPHGVSVDSSGNVFVADTFNHRIQKFTSSGSYLTQWGSQGSANGQFNVPSGVSVDSSGNVFIADGGNGRIQKFTSSGAWLASWGSSGSANGQFNLPSSVSVDSSGNVFVADTFNHRIQKFTSSGAWLASWGGQGSANSQFNYPNGISVDSSGNVFIADTFNDRIQKFTSNGSYLTQWGSQGSANGQFHVPSGVSVDSSGNVFVADSSNDHIQKFTNNGTWLASWGSPGSANGQFNYPNGISVDSSGNVFVADYSNHRIQKFTSSGAWLASWGTQGSANGQFNYPNGVSVDSSGNVFVADTGNDRIQKFTSSGAWLASWGTQGSANGQFNSPNGVSVDSSGNVFVADTYNDRIQKFSSSGAYLTQWGSQGSANGQFLEPYGVSVDSSGNVFVADTDNNRIQRFRPMTFTQPIATIVAAEPRSVVQGQVVHLYGMGSDSDATPALAAYEWLLDNNPAPFATTAAATLPTVNFSPGRHMISFRVRDTEGQLSELQTVSVDVSPSGSQQSQTWTFLLYLDGDAPNLAPYLNRTSALGALYRLEHTAANPNVTVVALYDGPLPGGGDSFRYVFHPDGTLTQDYLGEVNLGDPQTLIDFVRWGQQHAPADHYYLALADHANALDGIAWDFTTSRTERLTNSEIRQALVAITENGAHPLDVLHFDGCLMGLLESAYQVRGLARYLVASENIGWSAFAYEQYRAAIGAKTSPHDLAVAIADRYGLTVGAYGLPYTIAALDLGQVDAVARATDNLAGGLLRYALASATNRTTLTALRMQVQKLDSSASYVLRNDDEYVDLDHWAELVAGGVNDSGVRSAASALRTVIPALVLRAHATSGDLASVTGIPGSGYTLTNARGLGIYYPPRASVRTYQVYARGELNFALDTRWDEYLAAGLAGLPFDPSEPEPHPIAPLPLMPQYRVFLPAIQR